MNKVGIVYHYIAHYRMPIFKELANCTEVEFSFLSGIETDQNIKIATQSEFEISSMNWLRLKNIWFLSKKFLWQKGLIRNVISTKYNSFIFLGNPYFLSTWVALLVCKLKGVQACLWTHGYTDEIKGLKLLVLKLFWLMSNEIFLYGQYAKTNMLKLGVSSNKLKVIYNSLDYNTQLSVRKQLKNGAVFNERFENEYPVVIFVGRLTKIKKLDQLILAQSHLIRNGFPFNIVFVGEGEEKIKLEKLAIQNHTNANCWFYGSCYGEFDLGNLFYNSKICVAPGNVGLTAMHSMTYGTPVISHANFNNQMPEFEAIERGVTGDFFEENNIENLAEVMKQWLQKDDAEMKIIKNACLNIIDKHYNPKYQVEQILKGIR